jgi:hypothetical protein
MKIKDFVSEDTNQFGPGTDLVIALMAFLMIMIVISTYLHNYEKKRYEREAAKVKGLEHKVAEARKKIEAQEEGGNFKLASIKFLAGTFEMRPYAELKDESLTIESVKQVAQEYQALQSQFPYIFVIGHANKVDDPQAPDKSERERLQRNWRYAGERAGLIAKLLQEQLSEEQKVKIIVVSMGELDMRFPDQPKSTENAWVEVTFGKEWKPPSYEVQTAPNN